MIGGTSRRRLTDMRFCCASKMVTASEAREPDGYRNGSNRSLGGDRRLAQLRDLRRSYGLLGLRGLE